MCSLTDSNHLVVIIIIISVYSPFAPSESELNVEFSIDVLLCGPSGARFSLIDSCDELRVYLWVKLRHEKRVIRVSLIFFSFTNKNIFKNGIFFRTSDKSSRSWFRTVSQKSRKRSLARFLWFHFISSSLGCIPFCEK